MRVAQIACLDRLFSAQHGVATRAQVLRLGLSDRQVDWAVASGRWVAVHQGVFAPSGVRLTPDGRTLAACLACGPGAVVSHRSAALLWGLVDEVPPRPAITIPADRRVRRHGIDLHRSCALDPRRTRRQRGIPVTDPLRTLADLGSAVSRDQLDLAVDRGRQGRLVTITGLEAEVRRLGARGRQGPNTLRDALRRRGLIESPAPSVLESKVARLLRSWGVAVLAVEHTVCHGRYRLDFLLRVDVALEVDGYAYHSSPEAMEADARRRDDLADAGIRVIEANWTLVTRRPEELRARILRVLAAGPAARRGAR